MLNYPSTRIKYMYLFEINCYKVYILKLYCVGYGFFDLSLQKYNVIIIHENMR